MIDEPRIITKLLARPCPHATYAIVKSPIGSCQICRALSLTILGLVMEELNLVLAREPREVDNYDPRDDNSPGVW